MRDPDKARVLPVARYMLELGFSIVATSGTADFLAANGVACERINKVIEGRPPRRGPLPAMPDTLCTDLTPQGPPPRIDILVTPGLGAPAGGPGAGVPYEGRPPRLPPSR